MPTAPPAATRSFAEPPPGEAPQHTEGSGAPASTPEAPPKGLGAGSSQLTALGTGTVLRSAVSETASEENAAEEPGSGEEGEPPEGEPPAGEPPAGEPPAETPPPRDPDCENFPPSISASSASSTSINVSWSATRVPGCDNGVFDVTGTGLSLYGTSKTSGTATGLSPETRYCYTVSMSDRGSDEACATTRPRPMCAAPSIDASDNLPGRIELTGSPSSNCPTTISGAGVPSGATSFPVTARPTTCPGSYTYTATASKPGYDPNSASNGGTCVLPPEPEPECNPPTSVVAAALSRTRIRVSWTNSSNCSTHSVRGDNLNLSNASSSVTDTGLTCGTNYRYTVTASRTGYVSASDFASATTRPCPYTGGTPVTPTGPAAPRNFAVTATSHTAIELTWDEVSVADSYEVQSKQGRGASFPTDEEFDVGLVTSHVDDALSASTEWCYQVRTVDGERRSRWTSVTCATTNAAPALQAPANLRANSLARLSATLHWEAAAGAASYRVTFTPGWATEVTGTSHRLQGLGAGDSYRIEVRSLADGVVSDPSGTLTLTTANPQPPATLTATAGSGEVALSWSEGSGAGSWEGPGGSFAYEVKYSLQRRTPPETGTWATIRSHTSERQYTDSDVLGGRTYEYQVLTLLVGDHLLSSAYGSSAEATLAGGPPTPEDLAVSARASTALDVSWSAAAGASSYELRRRGTGGSWGAAFAAGTGTSHVDQRLDPATEYCYQVRSTGSGSTSGWSGERCGRTLRSAPANLRVDRMARTSVRLAWDASSGTLRYRVRGAGRPVDVIGTEHEVRGLSGGASHEFTVRGLFGREESEESGALAVTTPNPISPTGLDAEAASGEVTLSWDEGSGGGSWSGPGGSGSYEVTYLLERRTPAGSGDYTALASGLSGRTHVDASAVAGVEYEYRVRSTVVIPNFTIHAGEGPTAVSAVSARLPTPTGLTATARSAVAVDLSWDAVEGASGYRLRWRRSQEAEWRVPLLESSETSYAHTGLDPLTPLQYSVQAAGASPASDSEWSDSVPARTPAAGPAVPANLTAEATSAFSISVAWDASARATGYRVMRRKAGEPADPTIRVAGTNLDDDDLAPDTAYEYQVQALGAASEESAWSEAAEERTRVFAAPPGLTAEATSHTEVALDWDAVAGPGVGYRVQWKEASAAAWGAAVSVADTAHVVTGLEAATAYEFRVLAWKRSGAGVEYTSPPSDANATTLAPAGPELTVDDETASSVSLSWTALAGATGYTLERRSPYGSGAWTVVYGPDSGRTHEDTGLAAATSYGYQVRATLSGGRMTEWSEEAQAATDAEAPPAPVAPATPTDVTANGVSSSEIEITWTAVEGLTRYRLQRRPAGGGPNDWGPIASVAPSDTPSYRDTGLAPSTGFAYRVRSVLVVDGANFPSAWSETVSGTTDPVAPPTGPVAPATPTDVAAAGISSSEIDITWAAVAGVTRYRLQRRPDGGGPDDWAAIASADPSETPTYRDTGLAPNTGFDYRVRSVLVVDGETFRSAWSGTAAGRTNP